MPLWRWHGRTFARKALFFWTVTILSFAQNAPTGASLAPPPKHFDHVRIVVLENQDYESAIRNDLLKSLAQGVQSSAISATSTITRIQTT
jgi:hypothetical protein